MKKSEKICLKCIKKMFKCGEEGNEKAAGN